MSDRDEILNDEARNALFDVLEKQERRIKRLEMIRRDWAKDRRELNKIKTPAWRAGCAFSEARDGRLLRLIMGEDAD